MDEQSKKRALNKVPMRKLMATIKQDIRQELRPTASASKPKKTK